MIRATRSTREIFDDVYTLLVTIAKASPSMREDFISYHVGRHSPEKASAGSVTEWRFMGSLGMGGKFWVSLEHFSVSYYYSEDETPARVSTRTTCLTALRPLFDEWYRSAELQAAL